MSITRDLLAARNCVFAPTMELDYSGDALPLAGATITLQVRQYAGQPGDPVVQDVSVEFDDVPHYTDVGLRVLRIFPRIEKAALAAAPSGLNQPEVGEADRLFYEIKLTYADGLQDSLLTGTFILEPGVNNA